MSVKITIRDEHKNTILEKIVSSQNDMAHLFRDTLGVKSICWPDDASSIAELDTFGGYKYYAEYEDT